MNMNGNLYVASFTATVSTAGSIAYVKVATGAMVRIFDTFVECEDEPASDRTGIYWQRATTVNSPTASAVDILDVHEGQQAIQSEVKHTPTATDHAYASGAKVWLEGADILNGFKWLPVPGTGILVRGGEAVGLRFAPALSSVDLNVNFHIEELNVVAP